jgi:hypothetical protein
MARNLNRAWVTARRAIGRPDLHLHDLRHSGLTWSAATGASVAGSEGRSLGPCHCAGDENHRRRKLLSGFTSTRWLGSPGQG